jgi:hypothetical protein
VIHLISSYLRFGLGGEKKGGPVEAIVSDDELALGGFTSQRAVPPARPRASLSLRGAQRLEASITKGAIVAAAMINFHSWISSTLAG